jgi:hypothetical protein
MQTKISGLTGHSAYSQIAIFEAVDNLISANDRRGIRERCEHETKYRVRWFQ